MIIDDRELVKTGEYLYHLEKYGLMYLDMNRVKFDVELLRSEVSNFRYLSGAVSYFESAGTIFADNRGSVYTYLTKYAGCPAHYFTKKDTIGFSLDSGKVLTPLLNKGYAAEFLNYYMQYTSGKSKVALMDGLNNVAKPTKEFDNSGNPLSFVKYNVKEELNLRFYYKNYNVLGIPKKFLRCVSAPKDYIMVSGDFEQSDLRIAYNMLLRTRENINRVLKFDDMYEAIYKLVYEDEYDKEFFLENRAEIKQNTLACIYGQSMASTKFAQEYTNKLNAYLSRNEIYSEFKSRIQHKIDSDMPVIVNSYFGFSQMPYGYNRVDLLHQALNMPIQTGSSEIVINTVNSILDRFSEIGVTEDNGGIYLYFTRHDEPIFLLHKDHLDKTHIFAEHEDIYVKGWTPLKIKFQPMYNYGLVVDELVEEFHKDYANAKIDEFKLDKNNMELFIPTEEIAELYVHVISNKSKDFIIIYGPKTEKHVVAELPSGMSADAYMERYINAKSKFMCNVVYFRTVMPERVVQLPKYIKFSCNGKANHYMALDNIARELYEQI